MRRPGKLYSNRVYLHVTASKLSHTQFLSPWFCTDNLWVQTWVKQQHVTRLANGIISFDEESSYLLEELLLLPGQLPAAAVRVRQRTRWSHHFPASSARSGRVRCVLPHPRWRCPEEENKQNRLMLQRHHHHRISQAPTCTRIRENESKKSKLR